MLIFLIIAKMRMNLFCLLLSENLDFLDALPAGRCWAVMDGRWDNNNSLQVHGAT